MTGYLPGQEPAETGTTRRPPPPLPSGLGRSFDAESIFGIFKQTLEKQPKPPRQLDAQISPEFERICLKAMMKNRKARYESAQELADEIARALASA